MRPPATGTVTIMVRPPPGVSSTSMVASTASASPRATARPSPTPEPCGTSPSRWNGANIVSRSTSATPGPLSTTRICTRLPCSSAISPASNRTGAAVRRVSHRVRGDVGDHPLQQAGIGVDQRQIIGDRIADPADRDADQRPMHHLVHRRRPTQRNQHPGLQPGQVEQVRQQRVQLIRCLVGGRQQLASGPPRTRRSPVPQAGDGGLDGGQRRPQVVRQVPPARPSAPGRPASAAPPAGPATSADPARRRAPPGPRRPRPGCDPTASTAARTAPGSSRSRRSPRRRHRQD